MKNLWLHRLYSNIIGIIDRDLFNKGRFAYLVFFKILLPGVHDVVKLLAIPHFDCVIFRIGVVVELEVPFEPLTKL